MMIPANRRNPVRNAVEGALALTSAAVRAARNIQPLVSGATQLAQMVSKKRGSRSRGSRSGNISMSMRSAPVTQGFSFGANHQSIPKSCSFGGLKGVSFSGSQAFCLVQSAATSAGGPLPELIFGDDSISGATTGFYDTVPLRLGVQTQNTTGSSKQQCYIMALDPLATQFAIYRKFRVKKLLFMYVPKQGSNSTTQLALAFSPAFSNYQVPNTSSSNYTVTTLEQYECSSSFPSWEVGVLDCTPYLPKDRLMNSSNNYPPTNSFNAGTTANTFSPTDLAPGTLMGAIDGAVAGTVYGRLLMKYEIEFYYRGPYVDVDAPTMPPSIHLRSGENKTVPEPFERKGGDIHDDHFDDLAHDIVCVAKESSRIESLIPSASNTRAKSAPAGGVPRT